MNDIDLRLIAIKVPRVWREKVKEKSRAKNMTVNEYLWKLVEADHIGEEK